MISLKEKWYDFSDWLDEKGIPKPLFFLLIVLVVVAAIYFIKPDLFGVIVPAEETTLTVTVKDETTGNAVEGASVRVVGEGLEELSDTTNSLGQAEFTVPVGKIVKIYASKGDVKLVMPLQKEIAPDDEVFIKLSIPPKITYFSREIRFLDSDGSLFTKGRVDYSVACSSNDAFSLEARTYDGKDTISEIPSDCGTLNVSVKNVSGVDDFAAESQPYDVSTDTGAVEVKIKEKIIRGDAYVTLTTTDGKAVEKRCEILLENVKAGESVSEQPLEAGQTKVAFRDIRAGTYKARANCHGYYNVEESSEKEVSDGAVNFFLTATPTEPLPKKITVFFYEEGDESKPVGRVKLELYDTQYARGQPIETGLTDKDTGEYSFTVSEEKLYYLVAKKGSRLLFDKPAQVRPRDDPWKFEYIAEQKPTSALVVLVKDSDGKPVEKASVELFFEEDPMAPTGIEKRFTGVDGKVEYESIPEGDYYVTVSYAGFDPASSTPFTIIKDSTEPVNVEVTLKIGKGAFQFTVMDSSENPMPNASIKAIDLVDGSSVAEASSDKDGMASFNVRVDKNPFFVVELPGYMPYVTEPIKPVDGVTWEIRAVMIEETSRLKVKFLGLEKNNSSVEDFVEAGQSYTARVQLIVPKKAYGSAGIHFRTGSETENETSTLEEDIVSIGSVKSNAQRVFKSTSYSPPNGSSQDMSKQATGNAKWVEIEWKPGRNGLPKYGVFNATIEVAVDDLATDGDSVKISFRGWGVKNNYERDPVDSVLGKSASVSAKQGLYAKTYDVIYSVGSVNLCSEGYCRVVSVEDLSDKSKKSVFTDYSAVISNSYKLRFTINKAGAGVIKNAKFRISSPEKGLYFKDYLLRNASGAEVSGSTGGFEQLLDLGMLEQYKTFSGWINFDTAKEGVNTLVLSIESDKGAELELAVNVTVEAAREMNLEFAPKEIIPMIDNQIVFHTFEKVEDGQQDVQNAKVSVLLDGTEIGAGCTDSKGQFGIKLEAPKAGSTLKIRATKKGFKALESEISIDDKIFSLVPAELPLEFEPLPQDEKPVEFEIENYTAIPLTVSSFTPSSELAQYVELEDLEKVVGQEIKPGESLSISVNSKLTEKGLGVKKSVSLDETIAVELENSELNKKWASDLKVGFRIKLGGEVDLKECLSVDPAEWNFSTYGKSKTFSFQVKNNCTVNGNPVSLKDFGAKVSWLNENAVGTFTLTSDSFEEKVDSKLSESFTPITDTIPAGFDGTLALSFEPSSDTKSAKSTPSILFEAKHYSEKGTEEIKSSIKTSFSVNKLSECLRIVTEDEKGEIDLKSRQYNYGWGIIQDYFDRDPYAEENTTQTQPQQGIQQPWPNSQWQPPWQSSFGFNPWGNQQNQWQPQNDDVETGTFTLENACTDKVQVNLQLPSALEIEEKSFEVEPYGTHDVSVKPTARIGLFKVKVRAKLESEQGFYKDIGSVKVKVMRFDEISEKCKPVVEPTTFRATFLGWQKSAGRIINRCVDLGYRLRTLTADVFHCYSPDSQGTDMHGQCPLITNVWSGTPRIQQAGKGERMEVLEFGLQYDPHIIEQMKIPMEGTIEQRVGKIRIVFSKFMNSIVSPGVISVPIVNPQGQPKWIPREVIFEDPFEWLSMPGMLISNGDPNKLPGECIANQNYFVLESWGDQWKELGDSHFTENRFVWKANVPKREMLLPYAVANEEVVEKQYCGSADKIVSVKPTVYEDSESGVKLSFAIKNSAHHVVMTVDRSKMFTKCALVQTNLTVRVKRAFYNTEASDVTLPVLVRVLNKGVREWTDGCDQQEVEQRPIPEWASDTGCDPNLTGSAAFQQFGFDRLKFDWREGDFASTSCDPVLPKTNAINNDYFFCDGVQFSLALSKKFSEVWNLVDAISGKLGNDDRLTSVASVIGEDKDLLKEINSKPGELYRVFKKQLIVHDYAKDQRLLFFKKDDKTLLKAPALSDADDCNPKDLIDSINSIIDNLSAENEERYSQKVQRVLKSYKRELGRCYGDDVDELNVVGIIPSDIVDSMDASQGGAGGIWNFLENPEHVVFEYDEDLDAYIITFNEYSALHNQLLIQWRTNPEGPLTVKLSNLDVTESSDAWIEFLDILNSSGIEFMVGVRNKPGLSKESEDYIKEKAGNELDEDFSKLSSTDLSTARLIRDNYSDTFVQDFTAYYKDLGFNASDIEFRQYYSYDDEKGFYDEMNTKELEQTGEYWYKVEPYVELVAGENGEYSIAVDKILVKMAFKQNIAAIAAQENTLYDLNPLFYLPFDGEVGEGKANADYGVGFSKDMADKDIFYYYDSDGKWMKPVRRMPGLITLTPDYSQKYEKTRSGSILSINLRKGTFSYYPSSPVALEASWQSSGNNILYYALQPSTVYGDRDKLKELFVWWNNEPRSDSFKEFEPAPGCSGWSDSMLAGKVMLGNTSPWDSIAFVPATATGLSLEIVCAKEPTVLTAKPLGGTAESTSQTTGASGGLVSLNDQRGTKPSIKEYVAQLLEGNVCVDNRQRPSPDIIELNWNPRIEGLSDGFIKEAGGG